MNHIHTQNEIETRNTGVEPIGSTGLLDDAELAVLASHGVRLLDDLADLASDELMEIIGGPAMDRARADQVIMAARAHWFEKS
jgi:N utilization substance protein A